MSRAATVLTLVAALAAAGCGATAQVAPPKPGPAPLYATTTQSVDEGPVQVNTVEYTTFDGTRVPAFFAVPRAEPPRACLIWEDGLHSNKNSVAALFPGAARLGLALFTIDLRDHGTRATSPTELATAIRSPTKLKALVTGTVGDLMRASDYLYAQPACHHNLAYAGLSLGGMIGSVFVARDHQIKDVVLMSVPGRWTTLLHTTDQLLPGIVHHPAALRAALTLLSPLDPDRFVGQISPRPLLMLFGRQDPIVSRLAQRETIEAARPPKTVIEYTGGHIPFYGSATASNAGDIASFLLTRLVEPTFATR